MCVGGGVLWMRMCWGWGLTREGFTNAKEMGAGAEISEDLFKNKKREKGTSCGRRQRRGHRRQMCAPTSLPCPGLL